VTLPDVVYVVRPGNRNEELRYSLRSIAAHLPHRRVWLAGFCPSWVRNISFIPALSPSPRCRCFTVARSPR
jgi:hypothetical protein